MNHNINIEKNQTNLLEQTLQVLHNNEIGFETAKKIAQLLGQSVAENTQFIFWCPSQQEEDGAQFRLHFFRPKNNINFEKKSQIIDFQFFELPILKIGAFIFGVYENVKIGNRTQTGDFYQLIFTDKKGKAHSISDPMAYSMPFGAFAPSEVVDTSELCREGAPQLPKNVLEIHVPTVTEGGTLQDLLVFYQNLDKKISEKGILSDLEKCFTQYDAIELMPLQMQVQHEDRRQFWQEKNRKENEITLDLTLPDTQNWGYDILIAGSNAINPNLLKTKRIYEFLDFVKAMQTLTNEPKKVIVDVVYGHADSQGVRVLDKAFFAGDGMYGKVLDYRNVMVRAMLLETMRRMAGYGIDGFRVDASQDINNWNPTTQKLEYDAAFLEEMVEIGVPIIFEDGRPWPEKGWALKQTYREATQLLPQTIQWGPLTFADNNPHVFGFWQTKFHRIKEIAAYGAHWLTGSSNHDSLRKGANIHPYEAATNVFFGEKPSQIFHRGYHATATKLLENFLPGTPMDFAQGVTGTPWMFMRNTDTQWSLKIVAEEINFFHWFVTKEIYERKDFFKQIKSVFREYHQLEKFIHDLPLIVKLARYDWQKMIRLLKDRKMEYQVPTSEKGLQQLANFFLEDVHDFCNVEKNNQVENADYQQSVRKMRLENTWLKENMTANDLLEILPVYGAIVYHIRRKNLLTGEVWCFLGNMEGETVTLDLPKYSEIILQTTNVQVIDNQQIVLKNSEAILLKM